MNYFLRCYYCKNLSINIEIVLSNNGYLKNIPFKIFFKRYFVGKSIYNFRKVIHYMLCLVCS